ncbi:MAG: CorA family divalent cation transporter [Planctomycetota bacterium]
MTEDPPLHSEGLPPGMIASIDLASGAAWRHFDRLHEATRDWFESESKLEPLVIDELLAESTRPQVTRHSEGMTITLRGVNLTPGAAPEDMISVRIWAEPDRILSLQGPRLKAAEAVARELQAGRGPSTAGQLIAAIITGLTDRIGPVIEKLIAIVDDLEDRVIDPKLVADRLELITARQRIITLSRYLGPQAAAINDLVSSGYDGFDQADIDRLRFQSDRVTRGVEDLDALKSRCAIIQEELANDLAEKANTRIYAVTILAAIFLPLTLVSGMLGMNVGGVPLMEHDLGFWITTVALTVLGVGGYLLVRRFDWL